MRLSLLKIASRGRSLAGTRFYFPTPAGTPQNIHIDIDLRTPVTATNNNIFLRSEVRQKGDRILNRVNSFHLIT